VATPTTPGITVSPLERALARERERTRALREVGLLLDSTVPRDELLRRVLAAAARVTEAERATLYLTEDADTKLVSHAMEGGEATGRIVLTFGEGIAGTAAKERRTVSVPDAYGDPHFEPAWDQRTGFRTRSVLATPMLTPDARVVGVLQVLNRREQGAFDDDDRATLEALAAQAAVAIEGARHLEQIVATNRDLTELRGQLERSLRERNLLLEIEQLLSRTDSLDAFLGGALAGLMRECHAESGAVLLVGDTPDTLTYRAVKGTANEASLLGTTLRSKPLAVSVVQSGDPILCVDCAAEGATGDLSVLPGARPESLAIVPLPGEAGPIGVIELRNHERGHFTDADASLLQLVAANLSTGVELANARIERERATRLAAVGRILSNVLHDIRTPMTIISGYAQLMPGTESAEERARFASAIVKQFEHVQAMIGELLAFVRGETQMLPSRVMVEPFFRETVDVLRQELASRGVALSLEIREKGAARFDAAKITRLVHNLARNAADAMGTRGGGHFAITVARDGANLVLTFRDDGPGIPEGIRKQLFESFVTSGKPGGTGLGLAIVKKVVDEHHGSLSVDTGDHGTTFTVSLPLQGPPTGSMHPPPMPS
jgi:signal transduction histidine kinase